jgi:L-lactate dehydrogenase complex protein LldG
VVEHRSGLVELFCESLDEVGGRAVVCQQASLSAAVAGLIDRDELAAPVMVDGALAEVASGLVARGLRVGVPEEQAPLAGLAEAGVGITAALCGIATTGTVVIGPGIAHEGILSSLCSHHIVVLPAEVIQQDLASGLSAVEAYVGAGSRLAFVTGPSRTSDIELIPVLGVHGPLQLDVVIVVDKASTIDQTRHGHI